MVEVKADALEESFDAFQQDEDGVAALKEELELLKSKIASGAIAAQRPALDGVKSAAATSFIEGYLRRGVESGLEMKAVGGSSDAIGGFAVPREIDELIDSTLVAISPIRSIANVVKVGSAGYRKLITSGGTPSGWVGFEAARPETNTATFNEIVPASGELYANPAASQQMLDDAMFDVEQWLASEIASEFARAEGAAFVKGSGTSQPLGFLSSPNAATADDTRPMGAVPPRRSRPAPRRVQRQRGLARGADRDRGRRRDQLRRVRDSRRGPRSARSSRPSVSMGWSKADSVVTAKYASLSFGAFRAKRR